MKRNVNIDAVKQMLLEGVSFLRIAEATGWSTSEVSAYARALGITRQAGRPRKRDGGK